ncbi:MAG: AAA family ATPase [Spirochaetaceae bacterium]|jgi:SpoVK/Ycf46/Vps4 family AAA+-type ATPase|nr:AAA family ATPase [Spirochaetaceae bacterium]
MIGNIIKTVKEIVNHIHAGVPVIHISASEYLRLDDLVSEVADNLAFIKKEWNLGWGQIDSETKAPIGSKYIALQDFLDAVKDTIADGKFGLDKKLLYIKNAKLVLEGNKELTAYLQQIFLLIQRCFKGKCCVIYTSEERFIPPEFETLVYYIELAPPDRDELFEILKIYLEGIDCQISSELKNRFIQTCIGLDKESVLQILSMAFHNKTKFDEQDLDIARKVKEQMLAKTGYIEMVPLKEKFDDIGGLENVKQYIQRKKIIIDDIDAAIQKGIQPPKGILLAGMPGCGKSLAAKAAAYLFNLPLIRLDIGSLMGKYVGESENNLKNALKTAEHISPCVIWLDEIEKAFSGIKGGDGGNGVTSRMFGYFLTWMQEKPGTVFVIATANDINLPPELFRKGRFDECFYVNFPDQTEREQIFKIYLDKILDKQINISLSDLAELSEGYSGADIYALINEALEKAFVEKKILDKNIIDECMRNTTPLKKMLGEKIQEYENKFKEFHLKPATWTPDERKTFQDNLERESISSDPTVRERVAKDSQCPVSILEKLSLDNNNMVRTSVLLNKNCTSKIIEKFLFSSNITSEQFRIAISHRALLSDTIVNLYLSKKIDQNQMLEIVSKKEMDKVLLNFFEIMEYPLSIAEGVIKKIKVSENDTVFVNYRAVEIDDNNGNNHSISIRKNGIIKEIYVKQGQVVKKGDILMSVFYLK